MCIREEINGDNNYLSSPILTIRRIFSDDLVSKKSIFVDIGCGEGLVAFYMRLIKKKRIICCDFQSHYLRLIRMLSRLLFVSEVTCQKAPPFFMHDDVVFLCVWTSWSDSNRKQMIDQFLTHIPKGGMLVTVSHGIVHPDLIELKKIIEPFAWGQASVYYYKHA